MQTVEALYVPKSLTILKIENGYRVDVKNDLSMMAAIIVIAAIVSLIALPVSALVAGTGGALLYLLAAGAAVFYFVNKSRQFSPMYMSREGVRIDDLFYRMEDIQDFRDIADDVPADKTIKIGKLGNYQCIGIQYGLYSVPTPYFLSKTECTKVAPFLTDLLKSLSQDIGKDRERKIQQAHVF